MIDKFVPDVAAALAGVEDGSVILLAGFANGMPETLMEGLVAQGARDLTLVVNAGGRDDGPIAELLGSGRVRKLVCSFVRAASVAGRQFAAGKLELEIVPQGTLAERIRAAGAGIQAFYTPTGSRHAAGRRSRNARDQRAQLPAGIPPVRRCRVDRCLGG
jgi:3-oxoadipate CoA-transferase alpha subunit